MKKNIEEETGNVWIMRWIRASQSFTTVGVINQSYSIIERPVSGRSSNGQAIRNRLTINSSLCSTARVSRGH